MSASSLACGVLQVVGRYKIHLCTSATGPSTKPLSVIKATRYYSGENGHICGMRTGLMISQMRIVVAFTDSSSW